MTKAEFCEVMTRLRAAYDRGCEYYYKLSEMGVELEDGPFDDVFSETVSILEYIMHDWQGRIGHYIFELDWAVREFDYTYDMLYEIICDDNKEAKNV